MTTSNGCVTKLGSAQNIELGKLILNTFWVKFVLMPYGRMFGMVKGWILIGGGTASSWQILSQP